MQKASATARKRSTQRARRSSDDAAGAPGLDPAAPSLVPEDLSQMWDSLGYCIKRAQVRTYAMLFEMVMGGEMTPARMTALNIIDTDPGINQSALAARLGITGPSVVKVVDALERLGLIDRRLTEGDRRTRSLFLTEHGVAELKALRDNAARYEEAIAKNLSAVERRTLIALLDKVAEP
ncbi:MarR family winged helix-turn-helix transcriptional regulator [Pigmentiphaga litoralis]|uniref:MarR family winged helix-turn-helix transcriptional regulator n=1 Tax=Pigmentiphaga litoralis TaxID=516702 RepID=UPI003B43D1FD